MNRVGVLLAVSLLATSCAAAKKGGPYAGMNKYDAGTAAADIVRSETSKPDSLIYGKELAVSEMQEGTLPESRRAVWVVYLENFDNVRSRYCIYLWGKTIPFQPTTVRYGVDQCPADSGA